MNLIRNIVLFGKEYVMVRWAYKLLLERNICHALEQKWVGRENEFQGVAFLWTKTKGASGEARARSVAVAFWLCVGGGDPNYE